MFTFILVMAAGVIICYAIYRTYKKFTHSYISLYVPCCFYWDYPSD